ncbi:MAG TPA: MBOAT family O-acyltransferase, partial [Flavobacterium sp.]|nr:MBOAT family O-acyltransferase [Flavobacterium sp.]
VIADNCARFADMIFNNSEDYSGSTLVAGALFFSLQIYGDFSGYSDIAIGVSKLFGIDLLRNFAFPYFSRDIAEFWRRWHISLSSWFRDYLYYPLGGSQGNTWIKVRNTFIIFGVSGFWHGANWTFIFWGILNAVYFLPLLLTQKNRTNIDIVAKGKVFPSLKELFQMTTTFALVTLAWIFFRAKNMNHALNYIGEIFSSSLFTIPKFEKMGVALTLIQVILFFIIVEWLGRENKHALEKIGLKWNRFFRWFFYSFILFLIGMFISNEETPFIYFQF